MTATRATNTPLRRLHIVVRLGAVDAGHELLRIPIDDREPGRLHLHHQPVPFQEHVVVVPERDRPFHRLPCRQWHGCSKLRLYRPRLTSMATGSS